jgi:hypothetical protein
LVSQRTIQSAPAPAAAQGGERVGGVGAVAVEEVLGVVDDLLAAPLQPGHAVSDHGQVLRRRRLQHVPHVQRPRLPEQRDHRGLRGDEGEQVRVVFGANTRLARGAEGHELRLAQGERARAAEELGVLGVGARPAALDVVDAEAVEQGGDLELVLDGEAQALALGPVAQRRIEEVNLGLHRSSPPKNKKAPGGSPEAICGASALASGRAGAPGG